MSQSMIPAAPQPASTDPAHHLAQPDPTKKAETPALNPSSAFFSLSEQVELRYFCRVPGNVEYEDLLKPGFWRHVAQRLKIYSILTCVSDNGQFDVDLRVVEKVGNTIAVRPIRVARYTEDDRVEVRLAPEDFKIQFTPNRGHGVRNLTTGEWMVQDLATADAAKEWLRKHLAQ